MSLFGFLLPFQVQESDAGKYTVKAKNSQGKKSCAATLSILGMQYIELNFLQMQQILNFVLVNAV